MRNPKWSDFYLLQFEFQLNYLESFGLVLSSSIKFVFWILNPNLRFANKIVRCNIKKGKTSFLFINLNILFFINNFPIQSKIYQVLVEIL